MSKVIITTKDYSQQSVSTKTVDTEVKFLTQDLRGSTGEALIDGKWVKVYKDHFEGPYCNWRHERVIE